MRQNVTMFSWERMVHISVAGAFGHTKDEGQGHTCSIQTVMIDENFVKISQRQTSSNKIPEMKRHIFFIRLPLILEYLCTDSLIFCRMRNHHVARLERCGKKKRLRPGGSKIIQPWPPSFIAMRWSVYSILIYIYMCLHI